MRIFKRKRKWKIKDLSIEQKISFLCIIAVLLTGGAAVVHSVTNHESKTNKEQVKEVQFNNKGDEEKEHVLNYERVRIEEQMKEIENEKSVPEAETAEEKTVHE